MKPKKPYKYCFCAAGTFVLCGCIHLLFDWFRYNNTLNSAPFSVWILMNAIYFGGAAALCLVAGWLLRRKSKDGKDDSQ